MACPIYDIIIGVVVATLLDYPISFLSTVPRRPSLALLEASLNEYLAQPRPGGGVMVQLTATSHPSIGSPFRISPQRLLLIGYFSEDTVYTAHSLRVWKD